VICDDQGVYRFLDRTKDAIRRRGENISSFEVERALMEYPDVVKAAVIGVPASLGDEDVLAWLELGENTQIELTDLIRFLEPRLPYFAVPRYIAITPAMPLTENGKVKKFALREAGLPANAWDREAAGVVVSR
jgi:carnitine-CoA ligase